MGDNLDRASDRAMADAALAEAIIRREAARMPAGEPGDCELCGAWSARLVGGACAPCRDRHGLA